MALLVDGRAASLPDRMFNRPLRPSHSVPATRIVCDPRRADPWLWSVHEEDGGPCERTARINRNQRRGSIPSGTPVYLVHPADQIMHSTDGFLLVQI